MSMFHVIMKKLLGILHSFVACVKRLLCCLRPRLKGDSDVLPFHVSNNAAFYDTLPSGPGPDSAESWDNWQGKLGDTVPDRIQAYRERFVKDKRKSVDTQEEELQPDKTDLILKQLELEPAVKRTKKIVLKTRDNRASSNLFAVQSTGPVIPETGRELGLIEDTTAQEPEQSWDFDESSLDVTSVVKEARRKERAERQLKKKDSRSFDAVKLNM